MWLLVTDEPFITHKLEDKNKKICISAIERKNRSRAGRALVVSWLLTGMVLAWVYSSQLTSSMTVRQQTLPFTSLSQLLGQDTYTWGFLGGGSSASMLKVTDHTLTS